MLWHRGDGSKCAPRSLRSGGRLLLPPQSWTPSVHLLLNRASPPRRSDPEIEMSVPLRVVLLFPLLILLGHHDAGAQSEPRGGQRPQGYVYFGAATVGEPWSTRFFDNLTTADEVAFRQEAFEHLSLKVGDVVRARHAVSVRAAPWTQEPNPPRVIGHLRAGERIVVREIHWVPLTEDRRRAVFWIGFVREGATAAARR
jgi:hypothetical protein